MTAPLSEAALRRYSGTMLSARTSASRSRTQNASQSNDVNIHLCGLKQYESARSSPSWIHRSSGHTAAVPLIAASTCSHAPPAASATAPIGSMAFEEVVPTVATTYAGV